jgi:hypothetical protein
VASVIGIQETLKRRADFKFSPCLICVSSGNVF